MNFRKSRNNNKGFTLVEIIVVLVILAILAAIAIPALTGWIEKAQEKKDIVAARAMMTATQAELSEIYAQSTNLKEIPGIKITTGKIATDYDYSKTSIATEIHALSDEDPYIFIIGIGCGKSKEKNIADSNPNQIYFAAYMKDSKAIPIFFDGTKWTKKYPLEVDGNNIINVPGKKDKIRVNMCIIDAVPSTNNQSGKTWDTLKGKI